MSLLLPPPITLYVKLDNAGNTATLSACFAPNTMVRDAGRPYEGLAAITAWKAETTQQYHHPVMPLTVAHQHGTTVRTATHTGDFSGSPVTVDVDCVLEAGTILSLEMHV